MKEDNGCSYDDWIGRTRRLRGSFAAIVAFVLFMTGSVSAQWSGYPAKGIPRLPNGKPDLSAGAPKTIDSGPDLSGTWQIDRDRADPVIRSRDSSKVPFQLWARALATERVEDQAKDLPDARCLPYGVPRMSIYAPYKILQMPGLVVILYEQWTIFRQIFTDGRELPKDPTPTWLGYSVGRWEGETLVVESTGFNGELWLPSASPSTESLRVIERYRRLDFGHLQLQITIDDPKAYTMPWTYSADAELHPDDELIEGICVEN